MANSSITFDDDFIFKFPKKNRIQGLQRNLIIPNFFSNTYFLMRIVLKLLIKVSQVNLMIGDINLIP